jgi:AcrR family transcriptional regulator
MRLAAAWQRVNTLAVQLRTLPTIRLKTTALPYCRHRRCRPLPLQDPLAPAMDALKSLLQSSGGGGRHLADMLASLKGGGGAAAAVAKKGVAQDVLKFLMDFVSAFHWAWLVARGRVLAWRIRAVLPPHLFSCAQLSPPRRYNSALATTATSHTRTWPMSPCTQIPAAARRCVAGPALEKHGAISTLHARGCLTPHPLCFVTTAHALPPPHLLLQVLRLMQVFMRPAMLQPLVDMSHKLFLQLAGAPTTFLSARLAAHLDHVATTGCACSFAAAGSDDQLAELTRTAEALAQRLIEAFNTRCAAHSKASSRPWATLQLTRAGAWALLYWSLARMQAYSLGDTPTRVEVEDCLSSRNDDDDDDESEEWAPLQQLWQGKGVLVFALDERDFNRKYRIEYNEMDPVWYAFVTGDLAPAVCQLLRAGRSAAAGDAKTNALLSPWNGGLEFAVTWMRCTALLEPDGGNALLESYDPVSECAGREGTAGVAAGGL